MNHFLLLVIFLCALPQGFAQLSGQVTDEENIPLPFVNVYVEGSYTGTTTNQNGEYTLEIDSNKEEITLVFQYLGYKTHKEKLQTQELSKTIDVVLQTESFSLDEVVISSEDNPANAIIRNAIAERKNNLEKISAYTADFYSRGMWKVEDLPEAIMGQDLGDFSGSLDSTRSGIIYLSETMSKIAFQKPDKFHERILASKVSGDDNGFSFNSAREAQVDFYENNITINMPLVSPIANDAFGYYRYSLEGVFYSDEKQLINKIKVTPKREKDRVFEGYVYIVEDSWQVFGIDLSTTGDAIQAPFIKQLQFKQNFSYDAQEAMWVKLSQTIDFSFALFGMKGNGRFTAVYNDYDFAPNFDKNSFTNEVLYFEPEANKKDSLFWKNTRPVPLTEEEQNDYIKKDSIQEIRKSKVYLDSIDKKSNTFGFSDPIMGYTYKNSYKRWSLNYSGLLGDANFNTLQGWNLGSGVSFLKWFDERRTKGMQASVSANYGFADDKIRMTGSVVKQFNRVRRNVVRLSGGKTVQQFNADEPITPLVNAFTSLVYQQNHLKAYDRTFVEATYAQEVFNGLHLTTTAEYNHREPLFNQTDQTFFSEDGESYTSNNPLAPDDFTTAAIRPHNIWKATVQARINFAQKYYTYPDGKFQATNNRYPTLYVRYEKGFAASSTNYHFDKIAARLTQQVSMGNKGSSTYNLKAGTFFNAEDIAFTDYQHFNGNQTNFGSSASYTSVFNRMPYYEYSTNTSYLEGHWEHNFKGFLLGKVPLLNKLNFNLITGAHLLSTENRKPYSELSVGMDNVGFGNFRVFRIDYVHSFYEGGDNGGVVLGITILNGL